MELRLIGRALKYVNILPPARILDIPCGTGRLSEYLLQKGYSVEGADISPEMVRYTNQRLKGYVSRNADIARVENAEELSFPDATFAAAVSLRLFGHTPPENRLRVINELKRVSQSYLILVYYDRNSLVGMTRQAGRRKRGISWHPVSAAEIDGELKRAELEIINVFHLLRGLSETKVVVARI
ncbi:MAG: class I SAM-dependent methyltransferase [Candidatus Erginobacter occultus]|nr:class I SAM-dependent methyltransferase [Candidatus Erginobacter occultus]